MNHILPNVRTNLEQLRLHQQDQLIYNTEINKKT